ncbi:MAG: hypothetical protein K8S00_03565 [Bacteroidales bacterium]|nr:hypothetical protein [Bacteroidales bacterium]
MNGDYNNEYKKLDYSIRKKLLHELEPLNEYNVVKYFEDFRIIFKGVYYDYTLHGVLKGDTHRDTNKIKHIFDTIKCCLPYFSNNKILLIETPAIFKANMLTSPLHLLYFNSHNLSSGEAIPAIDKDLFIQSLLSELSGYFLVYRENDGSYFYDLFCGLLPFSKLFLSDNLIPSTMGEAVQCYSQKKYNYYKDIETVYHKYADCAVHEIDSKPINKYRYELQILYDEVIDLIYEKHKTGK